MRNDASFFTDSQTFCMATIECWNGTATRDAEVLFWVSRGGGGGGSGLWLGRKSLFFLWLGRLPEISLSSNLFRTGCVADGITLSEEWGDSPWWGHRVGVFPVKGTESGGIPHDKGREWGDSPWWDHHHGDCLAINPYNAELILYKSWGPKGLFQFEIIINVSVSSSRFIWIPMLWVYSHYKYF